MSARPALLRACAAFLIVCSFVFAAPAAQDDEQRAPAAPEPKQAGGHGWMVLADDDGAAALVHLPPRGSDPERRGLVRQVPLRLAIAPDRAAFWGERLDLIMASERVGEGDDVRSIRRVLQVRAVRAPAGWSYEPRDRPETLQPLPGEPALLGFVGAPDGPTVLLRDGPTWTLGIMRDGRWEFSEPGWDAPPRVSQRVHLVLHGRHPAILVEGAGGGVGALWTLPEQPGEAWESEPIQTRSVPVAKDSTILGIDGQIVEVERTGAGVSLHLCREGGTFPIADAPDVPDGAHIAPLLGESVVAMGWVDRPGDAPTLSPVSALRLIEVSIFAKQIVYEGAASQHGPLSVQDLQWVSVALLLATVCLIVMVLRPDGAQLQIKLPEGIVPAAMWRRFVSTIIDLSVGLLIADIAFDISIELGPAASQVGGVELLTILGSSALAATLGEAMLGRSFGKMLAGLGVIGVRPDGTVGRASLVGIVLRNVLKWGTPPIGLLALLDPMRRHPGDLVGQTIVVQRAEASPPV